MHEKREASLAPLGISEFEQQVYRHLLGAHGATVAELADALGVAPPRLRRAVTGLERAGMVTRTPGPANRYLPTAPDVAIETLVMNQQAELERVRALAMSWMPDYRDGTQTAPAELIEIVVGERAVLERFDQLQRAARHEIQVLDTPPYGSSERPMANPEELSALERGVVCRAIYDRTALELNPNAISAVMRYVAAGEQARVTSRLPLKLATFDRRIAFVPQSMDQHSRVSAIVVHPCSLLDVLLYVFDQLWDSAAPVSPVPGGEDGAPDSEELKILALLASGMKDEAVAHHLGWSYRTTRRRITALLDALGADNRFQAGLYAARRGWL